MQKVKGEPAIKKLKTNCSSVQLIHPKDSPANSIVENCKVNRNLLTHCSELYQEESEKQSADIKLGIKRNSHIIEKLILRERLNTLILILYAGNKGYSLAFRTTPRNNNEQDDSTAKLIELNPRPYEQKDLIDYINREELPPHIMYLLDRHYSFLFYNGCVITEVRDLRQSYPSLKFYIHHVILRPTFTSLHADINNIVTDHPELTSEEQQQLESQILLAANPNLCLDANHAICTKVSAINHNHRTWNTHELARSAAKCSQESLNRKRKLDQFTYRPGLELLDFRAGLVESGLKSVQNTGANKARSGLFGVKKPMLRRTTVEEIKPIPAPNFEPICIEPPTSQVFSEYKSYQRDEESSDCSPELLNFYILEPDMPTRERVYIKISILQRRSDSEVLGELYLDMGHKEGEKNGVECRFSLGTKSNASKYINQFKDILTEKGKIQVRITSGSKERQHQHVAAAHEKAKQHAAAAAANERQLSQLVNGAVGPRISLVQQNHHQTNVPNEMILHNRLQGNVDKSSQQMEIDALATKIQNEAQQFEAAVNAKHLQQQQHQHHQPKAAGTTRMNTALINILKSSPASNLNSDASAAVVNAINNSATLPPQQLQSVNQKLVAHKTAALANVRNVLNHNNAISCLFKNNLITVNSSRTGEQARTSATTTVAPPPTYTVKQGAADSKSALLPTVLVGGTLSTSDVNATNSPVLLEKLNSAVVGGNFIQKVVTSPMSSPPVAAPNATPPNTINLAQFQRLSGLQLPFSVLSVSSTGNLQHPGQLLTVSTTSSGAQGAGATQNAGSSMLDVDGSTVILANAPAANLAQLVTSGVKGLSQVTGTGQNLRTTSGSSSSILTQNPHHQSYQLVTTTPVVQRAQRSQQPQPQTSTVQRTPITVKMAAAAQNTNAAQGSLNQLQKQAQYQQFQQLYMKQQQQNNNASNVRRRSNPSESQ